MPVLSSALALRVVGKFEKPCQGLEKVRFADIEAGCVDALTSETGGDTGGWGEDAAGTPHHQLSKAPLGKLRNAHKLQVQEQLCLESTHQGQEFAFPPNPPRGARWLSMVGALQQEPCSRERGI